MRGALVTVATGTWPPLPPLCCQSHWLTCSYQHVHPLPPPGKGSWRGSGPYSLPLQRLLVQTSVQAKPGHVSPLQLTNISVPQQVSLPRQARPIPPPLAPVARLDLPPANDTVAVRARWGRRSCTSHLNRRLRSSSKEGGFPAPVSQDRELSAS